MSDVRYPTQEFQKKPMTLFQVTREMRDFLAQGAPHIPMDDHWARAKKIVQHGYGLSPLAWACALSQSVLWGKPIQWADFQGVWGLPLGAHIPLSRLFGYGWFCGRRFDLNEATLDPRWESEGIIDLVRDHWGGKTWQKPHDLGRFPGGHGASFSNQDGAARDLSAGGHGASFSNQDGAARDLSAGGHGAQASHQALAPGGDHPVARQANGPRILDVGTGSGCLLITLLLHFPGAQGYGLDYSQRALNAAHDNGQRHGVLMRAHWIYSDGLSCFNDAAAQVRQGGDGFPDCAVESPLFDIIVSNPPYVCCDASLPDDVRQWDPPLALYGGGDGLDAYRSWVGPMVQQLAPGGILVLEIGADQGKYVQALCVGAGLSPCYVTQDGDGKDRYVWGSRDHSTVT
jgi:methylase of polypeptide subunit release factors